MNSELFWAKVERRGPDDCWEWLMGRSPRGYGQTWFAGRGARAHRVAYQLAHGVRPTQLVLHTCDNPPCCNPRHLFEGTHMDNSRDKVQKGRQARGSRLAHPRVCGSAHGMAKLDEEKVAQILLRYTPGRRKGAGTSGALAAEFGVHRTLIHMVVSRRIWGHVGNVRRHRQDDAEGKIISS